MKTKRSRRREHECVGGPLCGARRPAFERFVYVDADGLPHFYRRIKVVRNDHSAMATFHHYFGTNEEWASTADPYLLPGDRVFRPLT